MRREPLPDVLKIWDITWTKRGKAWEGPEVGGPDDEMLQMAVHYERIVVQDNRYVMVDPWITLGRFTWEKDDLEEVPDEEKER
jgi:hypothetical protein